MGAFHRAGFVIATGSERDRFFISRFEFDWNAFPFASVFGFVHAKVKMRAAGKSGVSRTRQKLSRLNHLAWMHPATPLLQMAIMSESPVILPDEDKIVIRIKFNIRTTRVGII